MDRDLEITRLLRADREGDEEAFDRLVALVYPELRWLARAQLRRGRYGQTLDTTALVHVRRGATGILPAHRKEAASAYADYLRRYGRHEEANAVALPTASVPSQ